VEQIVNMKYVLNALVFSVIGIAILGASFALFDRVTPQNLWKEIVEDKNMALAIFMGALLLGIAQIIASAIHG